MICQKCLPGIRTGVICFRKVFATAFTLSFQGRPWKYEVVSGQRLHMIPSQRDSDTLTQIKGAFIALWNYTKVWRVEESLPLSDSIIETFPHLNYPLEDLTSTISIVIINVMIYWKSMDSISTCFIIVQKLPGKKYFLLPWYLSGLKQQ